MPNEAMQPVMLRLDGLSASQAALAAQELQGLLRDADPDLQISLHKPDRGTMDMGATLVLVLGSAAVGAVAKGIQAYMSRNREVKLKMSRAADPAAGLPAEEFEVSGDGRNVVAVLEAMHRR